MNDKISGKCIRKKIYVTTHGPQRMNPNVFDRTGDLVILRADLV